MTEHVSTAGTKSDERGIPILSIDAKLSAFRECLFSEYSTEDAIGHVVDLLAYTIDRFCKQSRSSRDEAREIVEAYAAHPTEVLDPELRAPTE